MKATIEFNLEKEKDLMAFVKVLGTVADMRIKSWFIMSSSFSTLSGSLLEMLSEILDLDDLLHTASMEYTLMRESGHVVGCTITFQCLLAEQKQGNLIRIPKTLVKRADNTIKKFDSSK